MTTVHVGVCGVACAASGPVQSRRHYCGWGASVVWKLAPGLLNVPGSEREWMSREQESSWSFSRAVFWKEIEMIGKPDRLLR